MFVEKLREEMYNIISKERVLVLVTMDADALCACKILQWLFKCDSVEYTLLPVRGRDDLINAYVDYAEQIKHMVLINCGGNINILELLQPLDDVIFYIVDSRRPLDLDNIYNQDQIKILMKEGETLEIPEFDDIYASSDDDEEESDEEGTPMKRRRTEDSESPHKSKKEKRIWAKKRQSILTQYYQNAFHGSSSAMVLYELCWKMSKDSNLLLWWSVVGLTDQLINERIDNDKYVSDAQILHEHVLRLNHDTGENGTSINCMKISFDHELRLALYRHWSIFDSLCHSGFTACMFRVWTLKGKRRLHEFLAELGLPLHQCQQKFSAMDVSLRNKLKESIIQVAEKYGLEEILFGSFNVQMGYKNKLCASDVVFATTALLENSTEEGKTYSENFLDALDGLSWCSSGLEKLQGGLELSKKHLVAIWNQVHSFISMHQVVCAGPFLYAHIREGAPDVKVFSTRMNVTRLARFVLNCYVIMSKNKRAATLPFVLASPLDSETGTCIVVGIPPVADESRKNFLGRAFEIAAEKTKTRSRHDHCEPAVVEVKSEDRGKFFDALSALLA
ncbi:cell division control protein 45 homolog [Dendronephthya gigantea]|uniref:cell division control protein 45 homolog n=1 Tax=Dendronephthya gigantea TaxID=151771 RepID=UPI00106D14F1|nr:cell division control protein 45 homolog [Dendronephthya gigantea]